MAFSPCGISQESGTRIRCLPSTQFCLLIIRTSHHIINKASWAESQVPLWMEISAWALNSTNCSDTKEVRGLSLWAPSATPLPHPGGGVWYFVILMILVTNCPTITKILSYCNTFWHQCQPCKHMDSMKATMCLTRATYIDLQLQNQTQVIVYFTPFGWSCSIPAQNSYCWLKFTQLHKILTGRCLYGRAHTNPTVSKEGKWNFKSGLFE